MRRRWILFGLLHGLLLVSACSRTPEGAIATFTRGSLSLDDIERARPAVEVVIDDDPAAAALEQYRHAARWLAVARALPEPEGAVAAEYRMRRAELLVEHYLERRGLTSPAIDSARLATAVSELRQHFDAASRRYVFNLFKRAPEIGPAATAARAELVALARRIRGGESMTRLAARHSDSESRAYNGELGWIGRGQLDPAVERAIWALEVGEPSAPVRVHGGWSLFLVTRRFDGASLAPEQIESLARTRERLAIDSEFLAALMPTAEPASGESKPQTPAAADGVEQTILRQRFETRFPELALVPPGAFEAFERRHQAIQRLAAHLEKEGWLDSAEAQGFERRLERRALAPRVEATLLARVATRVTADSPEVEAHYQANRGRYRTSLRLRVRLIRLPTTRAVVEQMEALSDGLDAGLGLERLAARFAVEVVDLGWLDGATMAAWEAKARRILLRTPVPGLTIPFTSGDFVSVAEVLERQEPVPLGFEAVKHRVRDDYLAARRAELLAAELERVLREIDFELDEAALRRRVLLDPAPGAAAEVGP